jgi:hypothetical protein
MSTNGLEEYTPDLGSCCVCGGTDGVVNIIMLSQKCQVPGHGWSCFVCGLPAEGATAVVCRDCWGNEERPDAVIPRLRWACRGYPKTDGRVPITELTGLHECDEAAHASEYAG